LSGQPLRLKPGEIRSLGAFFTGIEDFETVFPQPGWALFDINNTGHNWGDVPCHPLENSFEGFWSGWPASRGVNGLDPCNGDFYPDNLKTQLIYGPFSLENVVVY
jgi:hypothetical protein